MQKEYDEQNREVGVEFGQCGDSAVPQRRTLACAVGVAKVALAEAIRLLQDLEALHERSA